MSNQTQSKEKQEKQVSMSPQKELSKTIQSVEDRLKEMVNSGSMRVPKNYDPYSALWKAYIIIADMKVKDSNGNYTIPVFKQVKPQSISSALLEMVSKGLNPAKKHCAFIAYKDTLTLQEQYQGRILQARRAGLINWPAQVVWEGEDFDFEVDQETGEYKITNHKPDITKWTGDFDNIVAAYCTLTFNNGVRHIEVMTKKMIQKSWEKGQMKGKSDAHKDTPDQMAKRTVINRATKLYIDSYDDSDIDFSGQEENVKAYAVQEDAEELEASEQISEQGENESQKAEPGF